MKHHKHPQHTFGLRTERTQIFPRRGSSCRPSSEDSPQKTHLIINCEYVVNICESWSIMSVLLSLPLPVVQLGKRSFRPLTTHNPKICTFLHWRFPACKISLGKAIIFYQPGISQFTSHKETVIPMTGENTQSGRLDHQRWRPQKSEGKTMESPKRGYQHDTHTIETLVLVADLKTRLWINGALYLPVYP